MTIEVDKKTGKISMRNMPAVSLWRNQRENFIAHTLMVAEFAYRGAEQGISWEKIKEHLTQNIEVS